MLFQEKRPSNSAGASVINFEFEGRCLCNLVQYTIYNPVPYPDFL